MRFLDGQKDANKKKKKVARQPVYSKEKEATYYNILTPNSKVQCDVCEKDISKYVKVCTDERDFCVNCFASMDEWPQTYTVINKLNFPIFDVDWTAEEELLMMEAIERHGFGNWNEIAYQIATDKTPEEVEKHYQTVFINAPRFLPTNKDILTQRDPKTLKLTLPKSSKTETKKNKRMRQEHSPVNVGSSSLQRVTVSTSSLAANQAFLNTGNATEVVGFMPKRGDFQVQYDNEAELLLAQMQFNDDDTEEQKQMKYKILQIYNHRLTERIKRKQFVITRQLLDVKLQTQLEKARGKEQRQIYNAMKVFARFNPPQEHQKLVEGIIREKQIRQRIQELRHYKKMGMKNLAEVEEHLEEKKRKEEKNKRTQKAGEAAYLFDKNMSKSNASRRARGNLPQGPTNEKTSSGLPMEEVKLCDDVGLTPSQYVVIKETLIRQSLKNGFIKKDSLDGVFKVDKEKIHGIFDFLVKNGEVHCK